MTYEGILESFEARYRCGRFDEGKTGNVDLPLEGWHLLLCLRALKLVCEGIASAQGLSWEDSRGNLTQAHPDYWLKLAQAEFQKDCVEACPNSACPGTTREGAL